jgi:hypothetical protein
MLYLARLFFYIFKEMVFDNAEESNFKSAKFNARKFMVLILIMTSMLFNAWLLYRFVIVAIEFREMEAKVEECVTLNQENASSTPSQQEKSAPIASSDRNKSKTE